MSGSKLGIALGSLGALPVNGLRHPPTADTSGWYLWCGEEFSEDESWFSPLHVEHVGTYIPEVQPFLALAPGFRFLVAPGQVEVWFDVALLDV